MEWNGRVPKVKRLIKDSLSSGRLVAMFFFAGVSSGKRPLEKAALQQHLSFGERLAREGREAFSAANYTLAFTRFKQGVELLNWVQAKDKTMQPTLDDMYAMFLRNTAQAALKLERFQEAIRKFVARSKMGKNGTHI